MIISGGPRSHWRDFAPYLMRTENEHEARLVEMRGLAADNVTDAFRIMAALGSGTRSKRFYYHANINPRAEESLTEEQWEQAVDLLEKELGLEGQPRFVVEHDNGRVHRHVIWSRVDIDTMTMINQDWNYRTHHRTADALEKEFGHEATPRTRGSKDRKPDNREIQRGKETGIDPKDVAAELKELWQEADTGQAFAAALAERGYILADGDRGFVVIDQAGHLHSVARRVGARLAEVNARMADIDLDTVPTVAEAKALAKQRAAERQERGEAPDAPAPAESLEKSSASVTDHDKAAPPDSVALENIVHQAAEVAKELAPLLAELSEAAETHDAPAELAALARFALEKVKEAPGPEYVPITRARPSLFGRVAQKAADAIRFLRGEQSAASSVDRSAAPARPRPDAPPPPVAPAAAASEHQPAQIDRSAFQRFLADTFDTLRSVSDDGALIREGIDWQARQTGIPLLSDRPGDEALTACRRLMHETFAATRDNGGEPVTADGTSFWQRAFAAMTEAYDRAVEWVRDTAQGFVGRLMQERARAKDNHPRER